MLSALLGNAKDIDPERLDAEFADLLIAGEQIENAYQLFRDLIVFTNHRLVLVDKQGITGTKRVYVSIPYRSVDYFSKETAGHFDMDAEISIHIKGRPTPLVLEFKRGNNIHDVFRVLSHHVLSK